MAKYFDSHPGVERILLNLGIVSDESAERQAYRTENHQMSMDHYNISQSGGWHRQVLPTKYPSVGTLSLVECKVL